MQLPRPSTGDLVAGVTVALVALPQSLAYAELAGMPPQYGLFALALPALLAAIFVSSPYLQTGPVALTALFTFGALEPLAEPGSVTYIEMAALLALMVGALRLVLGALRLGSVAYILSEPVLVGFTTGAAIIIVLSQVPKILGVAVDGNVIPAAFDALGEVDAWQWESLAFALATTVVMFGGRRIHKLFPGVLLVVIVAVIVSEVGDYSGPVVGDLDGALFNFTIDFAWGSTTDLIVPAVVIALVGFAEPASIARTFAAEERMAWNANREMFAQGVANVTAGFSGAFPVGGSFSRSSLTRLAGATSAWAGAITGAVVLLALPFTGMLEALPTAVLAAIIVGSVVNLINYEALYRLVSQSRTQAVVGIGTMVATIVSAPRIERGVLVGVALSLAGHLWREMKVSTYSVRDGATLRVQPRGVLWFATVPEVDRLIRRALAEHEDIDRIVVDLSGVGRLDFTGAASLGRLFSELRQADVVVDIENVLPGSERAARVHLYDDAG